MTVVAMSSLLSIQSSSSTACRTSIGAQALLHGLLVGCLAGSLLGVGVYKSLALTTDKPHAGSNVLSLLDWFPGVVVATNAALQDWMVLSS
jgi:hypothetical protein